MQPIRKYFWHDLAAPLHAAGLRVQLIEMAFVRKQVSLARRRYVRPVVIGINHLGNGWIYPFIAIALWLSTAPKAHVTLLAAIITAILCHCTYPWIKHRVARSRPCEVDTSLVSLIRPLDRYSLPSGHCMTLTSVGLPIVSTFPEFSYIAVLAWALLSWGRVACAHHYPTDVIAGTFIGALMAWPVCSILLP